MLYEQKMSGPVINWPVRPKDRPDPSTNPEIGVHMRKWECTAVFAMDHYELINKHGDAIEMSVTAPASDWAEACKQLGEFRHE